MQTRIYTVSLDLSRNTRSCAGLFLIRKSGLERMESYFCVKNKLFCFGEKRTLVLHAVMSPT